MRILALAGLRFYTNLHTYTEPVNFLALLSGRSFMLILTIMQLDITLEFFFSFHFILFIQVLVIWSLC